MGLRDGFWQGALRGELTAPLPAAKGRDRFLTAEVEFRDIRKSPLSAADWQMLIDRFGADLLNTRSTTWRGLSAEEREAGPLELLSAHPTLMKRPVCWDSDRQTLGWNATAQAVWGL